MQISENITDFRSYIQREYERRCRKNPQYSLRSFAQCLGMDASSLSQFLRGKRNLSEKKMRQVAQKLRLKPKEFMRYISAGEKGYQNIDLDQFTLLSDWYHFAICELSLLDDFVSDPQWIAQKLGITVTQARGAIRRLLRLGWLTDYRGEWKFNGGNKTTLNNEFTNVALKSFQFQTLSKAQEALENIPLNKREQTGMTMAVSSERLAQANAMISQFRRKLCQFLEGGETKDAVYQLSISLFPLTKDEVSS